MRTNTHLAWILWAGLGLASCGDNANVVGLFDGGAGSTGSTTGATSGAAVGAGTGTTSTSGAGGSTPTGASTSATGSTSASTSTGTTASTGAGGAGGGITPDGAGGFTGSSTGAGGLTGTAGSGGSTGGSGGGPLFACNNPKDLTNPPSGYVSCASRMIHRAEKKQCPESIGRPQFLSDAGAGCHKDSDCAEKPHGHCEQWASLIGSGTRCEYGCVTDAECGAGQICLCGSPTGTCVTTMGCTVDSDCGGAFMCVGYYQGCEMTRFACQTRSDACGGDLDCPTTNCSDCACQRNGATAICASRCVQ